MKPTVKVMASEAGDYAVVLEQGGKKYVAWYDRYDYAVMAHNLFWCYTSADMEVPESLTSQMAVI